MNEAQQRLAAAMHTRGARAVANAVGLSEPAIRAHRDGTATPRAEARRRYAAALGILTTAWGEPTASEPASAALVVEHTDASLLERVVARFRDGSLPASERARAASIALRLAKQESPRPSSAQVDRLYDFAAAAVGAVESAEHYQEFDADTVVATCLRHLGAAHAHRQSVAGEVLTWCREVAADRATPQRTVSLVQAIEARAAEVVRGLEDGRDLVAACGRELVERVSPATRRELAPVFERFGLDARPLAPATYNPHWPLYLRLCEQNGWRPRDVGSLD